MKQIDIARKFASFKWRDLQLVLGEFVFITYVRSYSAPQDKDTMSNFLAADFNFSVPPPHLNFNVG